MWNKIGEVIESAITSRAIITALIGVGILSYVGFLKADRDQAVQAARRAWVHMDSVEALSDSTRSRLLDSLRVVERRAVQAEIEADRLDKELGRETQVRAALRVKVDSLQESIGAPVTEDTAGVRTVEWERYLEPLRIQAKAIVPPEPKRARLDLTLDLDSIPMTVRVGCGEAEGDFRPATVTVTLPPWADAKIEEVRQDPDVCNAGFWREEEDPWTWQSLVTGFASGTLAVLVLGLSL